jgi:hypothetical protein
VALCPRCSHGAQHSPLLAAAAAANVAYAAAAGVVAAEGLRGGVAAAAGSLSLARLLPQGCFYTTAQCDTAAADQ